MKYTENGDSITLEMSRAEYGNVLIAMGIAAGSATDRKAFWAWLEFLNELNEGNPQFVRYAIPEEFRPTR